jgi:copper(I)-binding protein
MFINIRCKALALTAAGLLLGSSAVAGAEAYSLGALEVDDPYAIETPPAAKSAAGYLSVTNHGTDTDRLVAVRSALPHAQIHAVETDASGVTRMRPVEGLEIAPGATVTLAPQGLHVMFMGLAAPFVAGTDIPATLVFEHAGEMPVAFSVRQRGPAQGAD